MNNNWLSCCGLVLMSLPAMADPVIDQDSGEGILKVTVTGTREAEPLAETPAMVNVISSESVEQVKPAHPSEILERVPGVHVNNIGGEGHMTAIRQPLTVDPVYLFLEDGIPIRSTGFFNPNALYEVNVPQAGGIEVLKGPGTALYGSDAIGGVINVLTASPPLQPEAGLTFEGGEHGWLRFLGTAGTMIGDDGIRADLNITRTDGWREAMEYERQSVTLRWDRFLNNGAKLKTVLAVSNIDQQTAGISPLTWDDYQNNPTVNYAPISYRDVLAVRLSSEYERKTADSLLSITPYLRSNSTELLANWSLSFDPLISEVTNDSVGLLLKYRRDLDPYRSRIIVGADIDYSPGRHEEQSIDPVREGRVYTDYTVGNTIYDYDVAFQALSPYVHGEISPTDQLRISTGLRYDLIGYDYDNNLTALDSGLHRRPESTKVQYNHLSPKLGATYAFSDQWSSFVSYRHAFRAPSETQLFRSGSAEDTVNLEPVKVDSYELGMRGESHDGRLNYEFAVYHMTKTDDIVRFDDGPTRIFVNAGETLHRGFEAGFGAEMLDRMRLDIAYSNARHTYEQWSPTPEVDYSGNEIVYAPRETINTRLTYQPDLFRGGRVELEWQHLGSYWMDNANTHRYGGYSLFNLRGDFNLNKQFNVYARVMNLTDKRYATRASYNSFRGEEYAPGMPRTVYIGMSYGF